MIEVQILENEYWWGGVVDRGTQMPFSAGTSCTVKVGMEGEDQSAPLFLSSMGRYIWSDKPFTITFARGIICIDKVYDVEVSSGHGTLKDAHQAAARKHFPASGVIPSESFFRVPQYNTWIELMYDQNEKQILQYAQAIVDSGLTPGILMIDEGWSEDYGVFDFYPGRFEDPKGMVRKLHDMGFVVMLWVTPHISPDSNAFRALRDTDFLLKDKDGKFAVREWWNGFSCVLDLSNPAACGWLKDRLSYVMEEYGVDGFKFDAGDPSIYCDSDRSFAPRLAQDHTTDYDAFAAGYTYNELRAVWNKGGAALVCRLHDKLHAWEGDGLDAIIPNTILQGLLGYYYGCPDMVGGGNYGSFIANGFHLDEELYMRWLEASLLCPMLQFSIAPWRVLSKENYDAVLQLLAYRQKYAPYFVELAEHAAKNNEPIVRHMEYEFPHQGYAQEKGMYMLGDRYLVVPMLEKGRTRRTVRLPEGTWEREDGTILSGGPVELEYSLEQLAVFKRCNENRV